MTKDSTKWDRDKMRRGTFSLHMSRVGAHRPANGGHLGFILWQCFQLLMGSSRDGCDVGQCGPLVTTHENHRGIPKLSGRDLGEGLTRQVSAVSQ